MERNTMSNSLNNYNDSHASLDLDEEDAKRSYVPPSPSNSDAGSEVEEVNFKPRAKKPKEGKKEGVVKRTLPVIADAIIFILELIIAVGFLYFAYIFPNRERDCWANDYGKEPLQFCTQEQTLNPDQNCEITTG
jgi:hypothetical protein